MPGPAWNAKVRELYKTADAARRQIDAFDYEEDDGTIRKEVFNGTSTVVEVAIKTKTKKGGKNKNNKNRNADENRADKRVRSGGRAAVAEDEMWKNMLRNDDTPKKASDKVLVRGTKRQVATLRSRKADYKKSNSGSSRAVAAKRVDDGDDVTDSAAAAAGSKFHNRTLQIFLHEMRAALEQEVTVEQDGKKTYRVHKILDDLEYVAQNMAGGSPASATAVPATPSQKQLGAPPEGGKPKDLPGSHISREVSFPGKSHSPGKSGGGGGGEREKEISELKALVTRLTKNNQEMLALLTGRVGTEENLKRQLDEERRKGERLNQRLLKAEADNARMGKIMGDMTSALNRDLNRVYPLPPPSSSSAASSRPQTALASAAAAASSRNIALAGNSNDTVATVDLALSDNEEEADSAIGNSETVSNARKSIIAEAKGLMGGGSSNKAEKAAQTSRNFEQADSRNLEQAASRNLEQAASRNLESSAAASAGNSNLREEAELELRSGPLDRSEFPNSTTGSPRRTTATTKTTTKGKKSAAFVLGDVDANVRAFLDRMRHQESLNITAPKLPTAKSFEGPSKVTLDYTTSDLNNSTVETLSESRFRKGLETSTISTSDAGN